MHKPSFLASLSKSQIAAAIATGLDFAVLFALVEFLHVWYVIAVAAGSVAGAVANFWLNRHWSFKATHTHWRNQALRYVVVSGISAGLNSGGAYLFTDIIGIHYAISVVLASVVVGVLFNFPLHRYFVFR